MISSINNDQNYNNDEYIDKEEDSFNVDEFKECEDNIENDNDEYEKSE